jgi:hypothetical protein
MERQPVLYPLSPDEHKALVRCISGVRKQLQNVSDLFTTRYGRESSIAELAVKTLVSSTLLEHELVTLETDQSDLNAESEPIPSISATGF